jgi:hypothetical protein
MDFPVPYFQPGHARRRAAIGAGHATGIEKQDATASLIAWHMRVAVQQNIHIVWHFIGWNVLKTEFHSTAHKIDYQWPIEIAVTVSAHDCDARPNPAQLVKNRFCTNITNVPDLIRIPGNFLHDLGQTIVRVRKNENAKRLFLFLLHAFQRQSGCWADKNKSRHGSEPWRLIEIVGRFCETPPERAASETHTLQTGYGATWS